MPEPVGSLTIRMDDGDGAALEPSDTVNTGDNPSALTAPGRVI